MKKRKSRLVRTAEAATPTAVILAVLLAWELFVRWRGIAPIYLPAPSAIATYLYRMTVDGSMLYNLGVTLLRIFAGFALAALTGILLGVLMGMSRMVARVADAWIAADQHFARFAGVRDAHSPNGQVSGAPSGRSCPSGVTAVVSSNHTKASNCSARRASK